MSTLLSTPSATLHRQEESQHIRCNSNEEVCNVFDVLIGDQASHCHPPKEDSFTIIGDETRRNSLEDSFVLIENQTSCFHPTLCTHCSRQSALPFQCEYCGSYYIVGASIPSLRAAFTPAQIADIEDVLRADFEDLRARSEANENYLSGFQQGCGDEMVEEMGLERLMKLMELMCEPGLQVKYFKREEEMEEEEDLSVKREAVESWVADQALQIVGEKEEEDFVML